ncbi:active regulator of SIRT1 [Nelusetta ayraudi]|uniref:active regulator of SIRT1 n=1 Tax=Nelusetta ayraudi TaxID=303726 RepID=UPI003F6E5A86
MSASLIRRGLELLADDVKDNRKANKKKDRRQKTQHSAAAAALPGDTNRQGVTKRLHGRKGPTKSKATVKNKTIKCALEEFKKKQRKSHMSFNLKYFTDTSCKATESDTKKIISHNTGRQSRNKLNQKPKKDTKDKKPESVFTEEEFQQFQREYFGSRI